MDSSPTCKHRRDLLQEMHSQVKRPPPLTHGSLKALPISAYKSGQSLKMVSFKSVTQFPTITSCLCVQKAALSKQGPGMKHECGCPQVKLSAVAAFIPAVCFCVICCTLLCKWWLVCPVLYLPLVRNDSSFPWYFPAAFDRGLYVQQIPDNVLGRWLT